MTDGFRYLLIGGGMAADAAARGIRQIDADGSIGLFSAEPDPPYNRPPLSKGLWKGAPLTRVWRNTASLGVELLLGQTVTQIDPARKVIAMQDGAVYTYEKLLLATGGEPIRISPEHERILYYRTLADYRRLRALTETERRFIVIGGGFIGSEIAAALAGLGKEVTILFPEAGIGARVLPAEISTYLNEVFAGRGVRVLAGRLARGISASGDAVTVTLDNDERITAGAVVAGLGIRPNVTLARAAGLMVDDGIVVDASLRTSDPHIFAAGDVISFYNPVLDRRLRVEHEENANLSGQLAGMGMAGQPQMYHHLPSVYSSLFDIHYDAVGELDPAYEVVYDWQEPLRKGVVYYLQGGRVRGVLLWNISRGLDAARQVIAEPGPWLGRDLKGRIGG